MFSKLALVSTVVGASVFPSEKSMLQFRAEAFNLSNTPTFTPPNARSNLLTAGNAAFGKLAGSQPVGRQIQCV